VDHGDDTTGVWALQVLAMGWSSAPYVSLRAAYTILSGDQSLLRHGVAVEVSYFGYGAVLRNYRNGLEVGLALVYYDYLSYNRSLFSFLPTIYSPPPMYGVLGTYQHTRRRKNLPRLHRRVSFLGVDFDASGLTSSGPIGKNERRRQRLPVSEVFDQ
jgi:hypothetical protein